MQKEDFSESARVGPAGRVMVLIFEIFAQSVRVGPAGRPPTRSGCQLLDVELVRS